MSKTDDNSKRLLWIGGGVLLLAVLLPPSSPPSLSRAKPRPSWPNPASATTTPARQNNERIERIRGTRNGVVQFAYVNPNYKVRVEPSVLIAAARAALKPGATAPTPK